MLLSGRFSQLHPLCLESFALVLLRADYDECQADISDCYCDPAINDTLGCEPVCRNTPGSYTCGCKAGYVLNRDGVTCQCNAAIFWLDLPFKKKKNQYSSSARHPECRHHLIVPLLPVSAENECLTGSHDCSCNDLEGCAVTCVDSVGTYSCYCNAGFVLFTDRLTCIDKDECLDDTSNKCECGAGLTGCSTTCNNNIGGYECGCSPGFTPDATTGFICVNQDECQASTHECRCETGLPDSCSPRCTDNQGSYTCGCSAGYVLDLDGKTCVDTDECATGNAGCNCDLVSKPGCSASCDNVDGSYECKCSEGFMVGGDRISCIGK